MRSGIECISGVMPHDFIAQGQDLLAEPQLKLIRKLVAAKDDKKATVTDTPSYEEDPETPKMPPGVKPVSPKSSQPKSGGDSDDSDSPDDSSKPTPGPKTTENPGDSPDLYDEVDVQAKATVYPYGTKCPYCHAATAHIEARLGPKAINECSEGHQYEAKEAIAVRKPIRDGAINKRLKNASNPPESELPNPDKKGATNPDNDTAPISSYDQGKKPDLGQMKWYMGTVDVETDEEGVAKWPLSFKRIEKDFKRPNKPANKRQEPKAKDSQKPAVEEEPYQTTTK